jgi:hypothetical protein
MRKVWLMNEPTTRPGLAYAVQHSLTCLCGDCIEARRFGQVLRFETSDDMGTECSTLCLASAEPPTDPESRIVLRGGRLLAEAHPERGEWVFTTVGKARLEIEARAMAVSA